MMKKTAIVMTFLLAFTTMLYAGYYEQGRSFFAKKNYGKAREMFQKAVESGGPGDAYYFLGEIEKIKSNYHEAENYYKSAISSGSTSRQYLINAYWNAVLMAEQRNDYEAVATICRSMWLKTGDASARQKLETLVNKLLWSDNNDAIDAYNRGMELKKNGKTAEALEKFQQALRTDPSFLSPKFELGMHAYNAGDMDRASGYLEDIATAIPFYAEVQLVLGDIQFARHNYQSALAHYDRAMEFGFIDRAAESRMRIKRGTCYYNMDDLPAAEKELDRALKYSPSSIEALLLMSTIKIRMEKYGDALKSLNKANAASPDNPEIQYQLGSVYYKQDDQRYIACFDRLFSLTGGKKENPAKYRKVFMILAKHYYEGRNYERASAILGVFDDKTHTFDSRLLAARTSFNLKKYDTAIEQFEKISPPSDDRFLLCKAYALTGRKEKAKALLAELAAGGTGDYLSRAKNDAALSAIAREIDSSGTVRKPEPDGKKTGGDTQPAPEQKQDTRGGGSGSGQ
jgi:tetratricopeptide (TPR) repeat protein